MLRFRQSSENLRPNLLDVLSGTSSPEQVNALVRVSHAMAVTLLRLKRNSGLALVAQGISESDLAYDCIADLFRRDDGGMYIGLRAFFDGLDLADADDAEVLVYLRRLVSSAVNQGIFRMYNEVDPTLGKILRNIKLSIQGLRNFREMEVFGEPCIVPILCDPLDDRLPMDREELTRRLVVAVRGSERTPEMLAALSHLLRRQDEFTRVVPLITVALSIRDVYARKRLSPPVSAESSDHTANEELIAAVEKACSNVKTRWEVKYVGKGKIAPAMFESYFLAIREYLMVKLNGGGTEMSLSASLRKVAPQIDDAEYRRRHRARLEYLARIVQKQTAKEVQR
jgi:hypothetical protein